MKRMRIVVAALAALWLGCAGDPPPESAHYLLRAETPTGLAPVPADQAAGFGRVSVAPYLERPGLILATGDHQVREASFHLWAEPLSHGIRLYLRDRVASRLGRELDAGPGTERTWRFRIDVAVEELHGTLDGRVRAAARWSLSDRDASAVVASGRYVRTGSQAGSGYPAMVEAQERLLDGLADEIADALRAAGESASESDAG